MKKGSNPEFNKFDTVMDALLKVPHSQIKAQLDAEKAAKKQRNVSRKRSKGQPSK